jgi:hypothetical protein
MLADREDDVGTSIDENGGAGMLDPRTEGDLDNRDGQQRNKEENDRTHVIPRQVDLPEEVSINNSGKIRIRRSLQKCIGADNRR